MALGLIITNEAPKLCFIFVNYLDATDWILIKLPEIMDLITLLCLLNCFYRVHHLSSLC